MEVLFCFPHYLGSFLFCKSFLLIAHVWTGGFSHVWTGGFMYGLAGSVKIIFCFNTALMYPAYSSALYLKAKSGPNGICTSNKSLRSYQRLLKSLCAKRNLPIASDLALVHSFILTFIILPNFISIGAESLLICRILSLEVKDKLPLLIILFEKIYTSFSPI